MTPPVLRAGPLRVSAQADVVRAFRRETGWREEDGPPPASFPVVWMRLPEIGEPIRAVTQEIGLPVHEAQHFDYARPLETGRSYNLMLELRRENNPMRLIATASVFDLSGAFVARVESTLRLIDPATISPRPAEAGSEPPEAAA